MQHRVALYWLRRDLRLADNPALRYACEHADAVVPIFIHAPDEEEPWRPGAASRWWLHESLDVLTREYAKRGQQLVLCSGPSLTTLRDLCSRCAATLVVWNRLYEPAIVARDSAIKANLRSAGIETRSFNAALLWEPWHIQTQHAEPYKVFTPFWRTCAQRLNEIDAPVATPKNFKPTTTAAHSASLESFGLLPQIRWDKKLALHWTPGETGARRTLERFLEKRADYSTSRDFPSADGTSRLSPHLHFGEIGPRQALASLHAQREFHADGDAFVRELGWREFAYHLLFHFPHTPLQPFDVRFKNLSWEKDSRVLDRWRRGRTGFPIVDAGMRELWETGYMHNRVRMLTASLLTKNLGIQWLEGARWFWDTLVDADLANNTLGWQWTAGCGADAAPYFRVFNPETQSARFDANGTYLRRWLPELSKLSDKFIHAPRNAGDAELHRANVNLGRTYPRPLVDLKVSRESALNRLKRSR